MSGKIALTILLTTFLLYNFCFASPPNTGPLKQVQHPAIPTLKRKPDLSIQSISTVPSKPKAGEGFEIRIIVRNSSGSTIPLNSMTQGVTNADKYGPGHHPVPKNSRQFTIPGTGTEATTLLVKIGNEATPRILPVPPIGPNKTATIKMNYAAEYPGNFQIKCVIDPQNVVKESNENNNTLSKTIHIHGPDFKIVDFFINPVNTSNIRVSDTITIYATIKNIGDAPSATFMHFDIHGDLPGQNDIVEHKEVPVSTIQPNQTTQAVYKFTPLAPGTYTFGGGVNTPIRIHELNEHNNSVPRIIKVRVKQAGVDLAVTRVYANHTTRYSWQNFVVHVLVRNTGNRPSRPFNVHLHRPHDYPPGTAQGTWIDSSKACSSLKPNETCHVEFKFNYKVFLGTFTARAEADPEHRTQDINRGNNKGTIKLTVK